MTENQKKEAVKRMHKLGLLKECIEAFEKESAVWMSEDNGILFDLNQRPEIEKRIKEFEDTYGGLVYHAILTQTTFGTLITLFYVSEEENEWELDWADMEDNCACCYAINLEDDICSEIGSIEYKSINGGLIRVA